MMRCAAVLIGATALLSAQDWPQFRGSGGRGVAADSSRPPVEFGPAKNLRWKVALPPGHSSPCIAGNRIFVTAFEKDGAKLHVIALDRTKGSELWRRTLTPKEVEQVHAVSSPATATPASDGELVVAYFGSYGLAAYSVDGKPLWEAPLPVAKAAFGSGNSPVISGDLVLIARDYNPDPELLAFSKKDGSRVWSAALEKKKTMGPNTGHSTPTIWKDEIILHRPGDLSAYSLKDGSKRWWVNLSTAGVSTPVAGPDAVYVGAYSNWGEPDLLPELPLYPQMLVNYDANKDGKLAFEEIPADFYILKRPGVPASVPGAYMPLRDPRMDGNKNGMLDEDEYKFLPEILKRVSTMQHGITAIKPGSSGDVSSTNVVWVERRNVPEVPAPLYYRGRVYAVMNGGIVTCVDAKTGKLIYRGRSEAPGAYFAAPVAANGHVYTASADGVIAVIEEADDLKIAARNNLNDPVYATPAIADSTLYVRSASALWAFATGAK